MRNLMANANKVTVDVTTGIGTLSFPRLFASTATEKKDGTKSYEVQIIIPKSQRSDLQALLKAIRTVGEAKWGDNWKKVRQPLRDGDKEKDELTEDGMSTKGEKYPERLGCYFLNARSTKPIAVVGRDRTPITNPDEVYGGCKGKIAVNFFAYSKEGNNGVGAGLNGVQKISDGEPFGGGAPAVESMFDLLDDEDLEDVDLDTVDETPDEEPTPPAKKAAAKKTAAKKTAAKKAAPEPEPEVDPDEDDLFDDLDDLD
jgi:hypothetical protein